MKFEVDHIYHVYNRGNNSQRVFFSRENYLFFLQEIEFSDQVTPSNLRTKRRSLNDSISIMLRSYARAIQKQEKTTGSLFQNRTKANCLTEIEGITPSWFHTCSGTKINIPDPGKDYLQVCFDYIHQNPVRSGLVKRAEEWEFSSYTDYYGLRNGQLIHRERMKESGLELRLDSAGD